MNRTSWKKKKNGFMHGDEGRGNIGAPSTLRAGLLRQVNTMDRLHSVRVSGLSYSAVTYAGYSPADDRLPLRVIVLARI